jgi:leucyl aminopeptidase
MKITVSGGPKIPDNVSLLAVACYEGSSGASLDPAWKKALKADTAAALDSGDFSGSSGSQTLIYPRAKGGPERILLVGLGASADVTAETLRTYAGAVGAACRRHDGSRAAVLLPTAAKKLDTTTRVRAITEGLSLGSYSFQEYKAVDRKNSRSRIKQADVILADGKGLAGARKACTVGSAVGYGVNLAREVGNLPGNALGPVEFATRVRKEARLADLKVKILDEKALEREKMGALLGVAQGSARPARLIAIEYAPKGKTTAPPLMFVGKAITFDSGGISIKPAEGMQDMKMDMCGGGAVLGAMATIGRIKPKQRVVGLIAAAENMPSGTAIRPGDILDSASGQTIEIINTDAEGRLVLADALHYAKRYKPRLVLDLATLTGACVVALGAVNAGVFSRDEKLSEKIRDLGREAGESFWPMPLEDPYFDLIKSDVADVKNSGGRWGGAITAAAFLGRFAEGYPWAHLDIAGTAWGDKESGYRVKGASGSAVRTLVHVAEVY